MSVEVAFATVLPKVVVVNGKNAESEEEDTLLLKVLQSVVEMRPRADAEAVGRLKVSC